MCSPSFLAAHGLLTPEDLLTVPIISPHDPWWPWRLRKAVIGVPEGQIRPGIRLGSQAHEGAVAMAGQDVAILTPFF